VAGALTGDAEFFAAGRLTVALNCLEGISVWHSIGEAAFQEVPHLHFHVHPRMIGDDALRIYPRARRCFVVGRHRRGPPVRSNVRPGELLCRQ